MGKEQDKWTREDQEDAAKKGQGAEIGPEHDPGETPATSGAGAGGFQGGPGAGDTPSGKEGPGGTSQQK